MPHMANHQYLPDQQRYETSQEFQQRVRDDVRAVTRTLIETTGRKPRVWVWPYGRASGEALQVIREEGYELFLTLEVGLADVQKPDNVPRLLMTGRDNIESIAALMVDEAPSPICGSRTSIWTTCTTPIRRSRPRTWTCWCSALRT
jgi:biofilm PGA synthesis lipoprotein PgaB